jgi:hypothetical protein
MAKKKKVTAKKNTTSNTDKNIKIEGSPKQLTDKDRKKAVDNLQKLKEGNVVTIPDDAVINIPVSGAFRKAIEGVLFYIMEPLSANQILISMTKIKTNFKDLKPEQVSDHDKAIWCIMTLLSELHWQAAEQKKTVMTDERIDESISSVIAGIEGATQELVNKVEQIKKKKNSTED